MTALKVAVDWDGTLVDPLTQEWLEDAEWALGRMIQAGWKVTVFSCRAGWPEGLASIAAKLDESRLSSVDVTNEKPDADVFVDDKALSFDGDWSAVLADINVLA